MSSVNPRENFAESRMYHQRNYAGTDYMDMVDGFRAELFNASYWADLFYRSNFFTAQSMRPDYLAVVTLGKKVEEWRTHTVLACIPAVLSSSPLSRPVLALIDPVFNRLQPC
jgi:hypothetical protein